MVKLKPNPTFLEKVTIPVAGGEPLVVEFEFRHKTKPQFLEWAGSKLPDIDAATQIVAGWRDVEEPFSQEALAEMLADHMPAALAIFEAYSLALRLGRAKN